MVVKWTNKQYTISETIGNDVNDSKCSISDQKFVKFIDFGSQLFETLKNHEFLTNTVLVEKK